MPSISELAEVNPKRQLPVGLSMDEQVSFIPMGDLSEEGEWLSRQARPLKEVFAGFTPILEGDVLFAKITPCMENGKGTHARNLINGIGFGSTEFHVLRARPNISPRFIFHLSQSRRLRLAAEAHMIGSAGQQRVQKQFFDKYQVLEVPFSEQKKIAQILDTLDTQIRQTEALIVKLERIKQGLLTDLLTRGIDQNGQLRPAPDKAPHLYKDSSLGRIPKEWKITQLSHMAEVKGGKRLPAGHDYVSEKTPYKYLRVTDFFERDYSLHSLNNLSEATFSALKRYEIQPGDLYISIAGSIGYVGVHRPKDSAGIRTILTENAARIIVQTDDIPEFLALAMNAFSVQAQIEVEKGTGGGVPKLALFRIESLRVALPRPDEQASIIERATSIDRRISHEYRGLAKTKLKKAGLMDDLLTGRVRVTPLLGLKEQSTI